MKITLPLPPNIANSRMHWRVKNKERKAYFEACEASLIAFYNGLATDALTWKPPETARVKATIHCGGHMDQDNALARLKWPIDWMVKAGYLRDDRSSQLFWHWPIEQVVSRKQVYRVEFELEALA